MTAPGARQAGGGRAEGRAHRAENAHRASPVNASGRGGSVDPGPALHERYRLTYPSGTVVMAFYTGGAPLEEVQVTHPLAVVEVAELPGADREAEAEGPVAR